MIEATDSALLLSAWAMGMLGSTHCVGMCGGISVALSFALPEESRRGWRLFAFQLAYNTGRILTYTLLGVAVGALAHGIPGGWAQSPWPRVAAGLLMVLMGLYLAGWWMGLQKLERMGGPVWKHLEPLRKIVLPVDRFWKALVAGGLWGFLPCGLVYSALALALARADTAVSGATMLAFGLGTMPVLLVTGTLAGRVRALLQRSGTRRAAGALVILFGAWTAGQALLMKHDGHAGHGGAASAHAGHGAAMDHSAGTKAADPVTAAAAGHDTPAIPRLAKPGLAAPDHHAGHAGAMKDKATAAGEVPTGSAPPPAKEPATMDPSTMPAMDHSHHLPPE